jgi:putative nucleotidyltransferase with HDIG domain
VESLACFSPLGLKPPEGIESLLITTVGYWDAFKRWRLAQQGLSSGKKRRVYDADGRMGALLGNARWVGCLLSVFFVIGFAALVSSQSPGDSWSNQDWQAVFSAATISLTALLMLRTNHRDMFNKNGILLLLLGGVLLHLTLVRMISLWVDVNEVRNQYKLLLIPFALAPMVHSVLLGRKEGTFSAVFVSLAGTMLMPAEEVVVYLTMSLVCGVVVVMLTHRVRKRLQLLRAGTYTGALALVLAVLFGEILDLAQIDQQSTMLAKGVMVLTSFGIGFITALIVSGLLPMLEGMFSLTTDISWLELGDLNHPLLKQMQLEAPGTFHHSLVVASLAESAAESIGANAALCRACAYFHDVGKLKKPEYFIENQSDGMDNPHDPLTPTMSALIIIAHVKDGVDMAMKHNLNPRIIDAILEHHGDSMVYYFYRKAQEQKLIESDKVGKGLENIEDLPQIDDKNFRYPGPRPRSKETGILSLADAIESASRTLKKPNPIKIRGLVDDIVKSRWVDGQLDDCSLTLRDLTKIRESFAATLRSMMHNRISYTKTEENDERKIASSKKGLEKKDGSDSSMGRVAMVANHKPL